MNDRMRYSETDPLHHTIKLKEMLEGIRGHLRKYIEKVSDPKAVALFETSAEVIGGLITAFTHFEQREEIAWKK